MKCPYCLTGFHDDWEKVGSFSDARNHYMVSNTICSECNRAIASLRTDSKTVSSSSVRIFLPKSISRAALSSDVPGEFSDDYKEACSVLADSPKASAALSRHCLQNLLREKAGVKCGDLIDEIQEVINSGALPPTLSQAIDAVRVLGNFAAHPIKSKNTGEIIDVEEGEAEWLLDVLEGLFDFYFVQPSILQAKRDALNKKLTEAGKPPLKG